MRFVYFLNVEKQKRAVVRKMEVLEASMAAEGKGAMGRVEQMKTFRKQVTALEEQIASITLEKEELSESNLKMNTKISDIDRRWKRKMEDVNRENVLIEERLNESELLLTEKKKECRAGKDEMRVMKRNFDNEKEELTQTHQLAVDEADATKENVIQSQNIQLTKLKKEITTLKEEEKKNSITTEQPPAYNSTNSANSANSANVALHQALQTELNDLKELHATTLQPRLKAMEIEKISFKKQILQFQLHVTELEAEIEQKNDPSSSSTKSNDGIRFKAENRRLKLDVEDLNSRLEVSTNENDVTLEKVRTLRSRINEVENDMKRTNLEKKEMEDLISSNHRSHEEESRSLQRSKTLLQDEITETVSKLHAKENQIIELEKDIQDIVAVTRNNSNNKDGMFLKMKKLSLKYVLLFFSLSFNSFHIKFPH